MLKILLGIIIYLIGAFSFFRLWLYRFPPKYYNGKRDDDKAWLDNDLIRRGWYTIGWFHHHSSNYNDRMVKQPVTIKNAAFISLIFWWMITPLSCIRHVLALLVRSLYRGFTWGLTLATPPQYTELPRPIDAAEEYANREVEKILSN